MNETNYLGFGDLVNNLFYILVKNNSDIKEVSYKQIEEHKKIIEQEAIKNNIKLAVITNPRRIWEFFIYRGDMYESGENHDSVIMKECVTPYHIIWKQAHLPLNLLLLLSSDSVINETLKMMGVKKSDKEIEDISLYIEALNKKINEYASKMEFEKCIELRDKLFELRSIEEELKDTDNKNKEYIKRSSYEQ